MPFLTQYIFIINFYYEKVPLPKYDKITLLKYYLIIVFYLFNKILCDVLFYVITY
jgi:hypothetical protein